MLLDAWYDSAKKSKISENKQIDISYVSCTLSVKVTAIKKAQRHYRQVYRKILSINCTFHKLFFRVWGIIKTDHGGNLTPMAAVSVNFRIFTEMIACWVSVQCTGRQLSSGIGTDNIYGPQILIIIVVQVVRTFFK